VNAYAVLIEVDVAGVDPDDGREALREQIVPAIRQMPGFQSGTWLPGNDDGKGLSLTVWDSRDSAQAMANAFGPGSSPAAGASVTRCEVREVVATV
jgi:heme-degrading monooxygenase HmoA